MNVGVMDHKAPIYGCQARRHCHGCLASSKTDEILNAIYPCLFLLDPYAFP